MTLANHVASELPRFLSFFRAADPKTERVATPVNPAVETRDPDKADDDDATSDIVWTLAYWPWL
ncbi:hypothetical protein K32_37590 [Kaistia sp. 32K]|uniref:hypothetical protein n=1 Tax=Kaistia sp. 32K TaxID=2795690 RepID=UPI001915252F|nr:hypothetical protein [Kaistia sp. 32K]BCP55142.1 hypothetical protein K32_37590 [Kaistia sp. 32K]